MIMAYCTVEEGQEGEDQIQLANLDKATYPLETFSTDPHQKMYDTAHFMNYFLCGYKAILAHDPEIKALVTGKPKGLKILIDSHVPPAAGLSSSSAFVVCTAVTTAHANGVLDKIPQKMLADLTINAERQAGTACGGMDQTISVMGEIGVAKLIEFIPNIQLFDVKVPSSCSLVVANSVTPSAKIATLGTRYNKRVVECRFALAAMALKAEKIENFEDCEYKTFRQLQDDLGYTFP
jgi:N-acetylgalactosamine kinase